MLMLFHDDTPGVSLIIEWDVQEFSYSSSDSSSKRSKASFFPCYCGISFWILEAWPRWLRVLSECKKAIMFWSTLGWRHVRSIFYQPLSNFELCVGIYRHIFYPNRTAVDNFLQLLKKCLCVPIIDPLKKTGLSTPLLKHMENPVHKTFKKKSSSSLTTHKFSLLVSRSFGSARRKRATGLSKVGSALAGRARAVTATTT